MAPPAASLDARALVDVMRRFAEALRAHREELDSLNVFPVPDGDTGTNMLLTQEAVTRALDDLSGEGLAEVGEAISRASLMGARGNSGVILSQVLRGLVSVLCRGGDPDAGRLAEALDAAARDARAAVARPQPGTILTVLDAAGVASAVAARAGAGPAAVAEAALTAAGEALEATRDLLPELRDAGVVDAGGRGAVLMFDALVSVLSGEPLRVEVGPLGPVGRAAGDGVAQAPLTFTHEVMYLLEAPDDAVAALRESLGAIGDSVVVVGGGGLYHVHVHSSDADEAVEAGRAVGAPREVRVSDLREQVGERCVAGQARAVQVAQQRVGLVAVAEGEGIADVFRSLGAVVVAGGPGRNPSVAELHAAAELTALPAVVILPNHRNVIPAAELAADAASADARVVPTRSIPAGLAAAAAFNPLGDLDDVAAEMSESASRCAAGEIAVAEKDAGTEAGPVIRGQWLGMVDGSVSVIGDDPADVAARLAAGLVRPDHEIVTLVLGQGADPAEAARVRERLAEVAGSAELEVHHGGQPRYRYLIGAE